MELAETAQSVTTAHHDAPVHNPSGLETAEIEVTDPAHPLFGRRFPVVLVATSPRARGHVYVAAGAWC